MTKYFQFLFTIILVFTINSCSKAKIDNYQEVYEVELVGTWSSATHPTDFPSNAHFSPMIGLSHLESLEVLAEGLSASKGVQSMAETGNTDLLEKEFDKFHNQTYSLDKMIGEGFVSPGKSKIVQIGVERGRHVVSVFSMIAPSPDWFVAASVNLIDPKDGKFYDEVSVNAIAYDAGTDGGLTFTSENLASVPVEGIHRIQSGPLAEGSDTVRNIAKFIFRRIER